MTGATHWARAVAQTFKPTRQQLVAQALQAIEDEPEMEIEALIRQANGQPPLPPKNERILAERIRLEAMSTDEILAERVEQARWLQEAIREAEAKSAAEEAHIKEIYGKAPDSPEMFR